jgi:hypothetical protein
MSTSPGASQRLEPRVPALPYPASVYLSPAGLINKLEIDSARSNNHSVPIQMFASRISPVMRDSRPFTTPPGTKTADWKSSLPVLVLLHGDRLAKRPKIAMERVLIGVY